jgi:hypothetical protein
MVPSLSNQGEEIEHTFICQVDQDNFVFLHFCIFQESGETYEYRDSHLNYCG